MMSRIVLIVLLMMAEGCFYSAHAQCAADDKIYIDPRLLPRPLNCSPDGLARIMAGERWHQTPSGQEIIRRCLEQAQNQPIRIPLGSGQVLVHPTNPCIQQYIP
jgi:hypothetical protein